MLNAKYRPAFELSSKLCRYCNQELVVEQAVSTFSYWSAQLYFCHETCKVVGEREMKIACQQVDADCNDCLFFYRFKHTAEAGSKSAKGICPGWCDKLNCPTESYPLFGTGRSCFVHRNQAGPDELALKLKIEREFDK